MKYNLIASIVFLVTACKGPESETQRVEVSCGQCQFGLTSQEGCDLAVRIDGEAYFADGVHIDDFGDAHDQDTGFCEVVRTAEVSGKLVDERFQVTHMTLTPQ